MLKLEKPDGIAKPKIDNEPEKEQFGTRLYPVIKEAIATIKETTGKDHNELFHEMIVLYVEAYNKNNKQNPIPITIE